MNFRSFALNPVYCLLSEEDEKEKHNAVVNSGLSLKIVFMHSGKPINAFYLAAQKLPQRCLGNNSSVGLIDCQ